MVNYDTRILEAFKQFGGRPSVPHNHYDGDNNKPVRIEFISSKSVVDLLQAELKKRYGLQQEGFISANIFTIPHDSLSESLLVMEIYDASGNDKRERVKTVADFLSHLHHDINNIYLRLKHQLPKK